MTQNDAAAPMKHREFCDPRGQHRLANLLDTVNPLYHLHYKMRTEQGELDLLSPEEVGIPNFGDEPVRARGH